MENLGSSSEGSDARCEEDHSRQVTLSLGQLQPEVVILVNYLGNTQNHLLCDIRESTARLFRCCTVPSCGLHCDCDGDIETGRNDALRCLFLSLAYLTMTLLRYVLH